MSDAFVPRGWYNISRALGDGARNRWLGLYCSMDCLSRALPRMKSEEKTHATRLGLPTDDRAEKARLIDEVLSLLSRGFSVREAADMVGVDAKTLKEWLNAGSICTTPGASPVGRPGEQPRKAPKPAVTDLLADADRSPLAILNEAVQARYLEEPKWVQTFEGPDHQRTYFATVVSRTTSPEAEPVTGRGTASTWQAARTQAALQLLVGVGGERSED